jgi:hypothetical protein
VAAFGSDALSRGTAPDARAHVGHASRSVARGGHGGLSARTPGRPGVEPHGRVHVPGVTTPITPGQHTRLRVAADTPAGHVSHEEELWAEDTPGPVCQLDQVVCSYEP